MISKFRPLLRYHAQLFVPNDGHDSGQIIEQGDIKDLQERKSFRRDAIADMAQLKKTKRISDPAFN